MKLFDKLRNHFKQNRLEVELLDGIDLDAIKDPQELHLFLQSKFQSTFEKREELRMKYEKVLEDLTIVQKIDDLPKDTLGELENLAQIYSEGFLQKENYQRKLKEITEVPKYLEKYVDDIPRAIHELQEHEAKQTTIRNDLVHLEGERADILFRLNRGTAIIKFLNGMLVFVAFLAAISAFILTTLHFVYNANILIPAMSMVVIIIFLALWVYVFKRYMIYEIKKNQKLQKRLVEIHNKIKIKYVNVQQFLDFEYKKYQVNSSEMLALRWENFKKNARNEEDYKRITKNLSATVQDVDRLLAKHNLDPNRFFNEHIDYFISKKGRKLLMNSLEEERDGLKEEYQKCQQEVEVLDRLIQSR